MGNFCTFLSFFCELETAPKPDLIQKNSPKNPKKHVIPPKIKCTFASREKCSILLLELLHAQISTLRHAGQLEVAVVCSLRPRPRHSRC